MKEVKHVEFLGAENQSKSLGEPPCFSVDFRLVPKPSKPWLVLFELELENFNLDQRIKSSKNSEDQNSGKENADKLTWEFSRLKEFKFGDSVYVNCSSVEEIEPLHEALKQLVRQTNEKLQATEIKTVMDKSEIERLKQKLKSEI